MTPVINSTSYIGLFIITVFSGTFLPGPSDPVIVGMFTLGFNSIMVFFIATLAMIIARIINYYVGSLGEEYVVRKKGWIKPKQAEQSKKLFSKYGTLVLLFTWVPFIDDPLTVVAGFMRFPFAKYIFYTTIAVLIRHTGLYLIYLWLPDFQF